MNKSELSKLNKKGAMEMGANVETLIGVLILIVLASALIPDVFSNLLTINGTAGTPTWFYPVIVVVVGAGFVFLIWKAVSK